MEAILIENVIMIPYKNDLKVINTQVTVIDLRFSELISDCNRLTPFGVVIRYPGSSMTEGEEHVIFAISAARKISDLAHNFFSSFC